MWKFFNQNIVKTGRIKVLWLFLFLIIKFIHAMKNQLFFVLILFCWVACSQKENVKPQVFEYAVNPGQAGVTEERLIYIDNLLQEYVDKGIIPHALTFVAKNGVVIHNKAYGWSNVESETPLKKDDIFRNFSQTKAVATVALMTLFEQGKFQLDDPVSKYIPECTDQVLLALADDGSATTRKVASPLTIRHLLCHTSGISGNRDISRLRAQQMAKRDNKPYETLAEDVKNLVQLPLAFDPGTQWSYHPSSDVCGYLVEFFSGMSLREYVKDNILIPLGMNDTDWYYPEEYKSRMVTTYTERDGKLEPMANAWSGRDPFGSDTRYCQAGTGLNGKIEDYARFCQMILNGGEFNGKRILGRRTIEIMSEDQLPHPNNGGAGFCFGLGFQIYADQNAADKPIGDVTPMVTPGSLSWGGMHNTDYIIDPKENMIILLYTNRIPDTKVWEKFLNTLYQAIE